MKSELRRWLWLCALALSKVAAAGGVQPAETYRELIYMSAGGQDLHLDVYLHPAARQSPAPVLVHFHGGAWWKGARPTSWQGFAAYLDAGFSVVTVQYRLAGTAPAPAAVQDVRCSIAWVGKHAAGYGFDPRRIVATGTSAGGHLALLAGMARNDDDIDLPQCRDPPRVAAIVDFYGPTDLDAWPAPRPGGGFLPAPHSSITRWIGERPDADVMRKRMSPVNYVREDLPPIFIVHGDADPVVPLQESLTLKQLLDAAGARNGLHIVPGGVHGKFSDEQQRAIDKDVLDFLAPYLFVSRN